MKNGLLMLLAAASALPACRLDFNRGQVVRVDTVFVDGKGYQIPTVKAGLICSPDTTRKK